MSKALRSSRSGEVGGCRGGVSQRRHGIFGLLHTLNRDCKIFFPFPSPCRMVNQVGGAGFGVWVLGKSLYKSKALTVSKRALGKSLYKTKALTLLQSNTQNLYTCAHTAAHAKRLVLDCKSVKDIDYKGYCPNRHLTGVRNTPRTCLKQGFFGGVYV